MWFVDGSKMDSGTVAGVVRVNSRWQRSLRSFCPVFQAEIFTINVCVLENLKIHKLIYIFSDIQTAIRALDSNEVESRLVCNCLKQVGSART